VWDLLYLDDNDLRPLSWTQRRRVLQGIGLSPDPNASALAITTVYDDVPALLRATFGLGLEGIVAKLPASTYSSGVRCNDWIKVKHPHARDLQPSSRRTWRRTA
jgi:ATP-dependent DNA ligase